MKVHRRRPRHAHRCLVKWGVAGRTPPAPVSIFFKLRALPPSCGWAQARPLLTARPSLPTRRPGLSLSSRQGPALRRRLCARVLPSPRPAGWSAGVGTVLTAWVTESPEGRQGPWTVRGAEPPAHVWKVMRNRSKFALVWVLNATPRVQVLLLNLCQLHAHLMPLSWDDVNYPLET